MMVCRLTLQTSACNGPIIMWADSSDINGAAGTADWKASGNINTIMGSAYAAHWGAGTWVAVGSSGGTSSIATSLDGINWNGLGSVMFPWGFDVIYGMPLGTAAGMYIYGLTLPTLMVIL